MSKPRSVLLVGSVPFSNAADVFSKTIKILGSRLKRLPDGETGDRLQWVWWIRPTLDANPNLIPDLVERKQDQRIISPIEEKRASPLPHLRPTPDATAGSIKLLPLGYGDQAKSSYEIFARMKRDGAIPEAVRFQISLPTPAACLNAHIRPDARAMMEAPFEEALDHEIEIIANALPHNQLAIQWDVCTEIAVWEGVRPSWFQPVRQGILDRLVKLCEMIPNDIELGLHLCHGDRDHKHWAEPKDTSHLVDIANAILQKAPRPITWIHMPVPRDRTDDAYFAPLKHLRLGATTELYLGLVHYNDGFSGSLRRTQTAKKFYERFGLSTECGLGRRPTETVEELLRIHAELSDAEI